MIAVLQNLAPGLPVAAATSGQSGVIGDPAAGPGDSTFWQVLTQIDGATVKSNLVSPPELTASESTTVEKPIAPEPDISTDAGLPDAAFFNIPLPAVAFTALPLDTAAFQGVKPQQRLDQGQPIAAAPTAAADASESPSIAPPVGTAFPVTAEEPDQTPASNGLAPPAGAMGIPNAVPAAQSLSAYPNRSPRTMDRPAQVSSDIAATTAPEEQPLKTAMPQKPMPIPRAVATSTLPAVAGPGSALATPSVGPAQKVAPNARPDASAAPAPQSPDPMNLAPAPSENPYIAPQQSAAEAILRQKWGGAAPKVEVAVEIVPRTERASPGIAGLMPPMAQTLVHEIAPMPLDKGPPKSATINKDKTTNLPRAALVPVANDPETQSVALESILPPAQNDTVLRGGGFAESGLPPALTQNAAPFAPLAPAALTNSPQAPATVAALAPVIVEMSRNGSDGPIEIALAPEELGHLTISLRQEGDFVRVSMQAERPETLDLLRRHAGDLLADLRQSGFSGASFSFAQGRQDQQAHGLDNAATPETALPAQAAMPDFDHARQNRPTKNNGLDLRL